MIVVDAMVLNYGLIRHPQFSDDVDAVQTKDPTWSGPPIWKSEQRNVLMKYVGATDPRIPRTDIDLEDAQAYMEDAEAWMRTVGVASATVLSLADGSGCTAYDCEYVALAHRLDVPLLTYDEFVLDAFPDTALRPSEFLAAHGD